MSFVKQVFEEHIRRIYHKEKSMPLSATSKGKFGEFEYLGDITTKQTRT